jgi:hypothetical protein
MQTWGEGVEVKLHAFLTSALDESEWWVQRSSRFTPEKTAPSTYSIGGWVGTGACLDAEAKRRIFIPAANRTPVVHPAANYVPDWALKIRIKLFHFHSTGPETTLRLECVWAHPRVTHSRNAKLFKLNVHI